MKKCTKCQKILPENDFYKNRREKDGLQWECIGCKKEYSRKIVEKYKSINEKCNIREGIKQCATCKKWKDKSEFRRHNSSKEGLRYQCKECEYPYLRAYYQENKKYFRQYKKDKPQKFGIYFYIKKFGGSNLENVPEEIKEKIKKTRQKSQTTYYEHNKNKQKYKERKRGNRRDFRHRHPNNGRTTIFEEKNLKENFSLEAWKQKVAETNDICPQCERLYAEGYGVSLDHNPPVSKAPIGFIYTINDVRPICKSCNSSKNNRFESYNTSIYNFSSKV